MNRIAEVRKERNLTQRQLSKLINCSRGNISDYENERVMPSLQRIIEIADCLDTSIDYLIGRSNDMGIIETDANLTRFQSMLLSTVDELPTHEQYQVLGFAQALIK